MACTLEHPKPRTWASATLIAAKWRAYTSPARTPAPALSGAYYHVQATYWAPQGLLELLTPNMGSNIPYWTYRLDGEGRVSMVNSSIGTQQNPVTATSYNGFSEPTAVTFGSSDSDAFQYDANTGRMTQYKASVNSTSMTGTLTWNANWTLGTLAITDNLNSADTQTCTYGYDSLARLTSDSCGTVWSQTFTYDAFGNISKSGSQSFGPTYSASTNRFTAIGSVTPTYDSNGNLTYDGFYNYTWDGEGNLATLGGNAETYDALNRRVEQYNGSAYTEIVYGPAGNKMALMSGQTVTKVFASLSAGATAVYNSSGLSYYRHPDWLGSSRVASTTTRTLYYDGAYAPFGENYAETGTTDRSFTGQNQDLTPGSSGLLYDFFYREQHSTQGRWISPDPSGINATDPANPQTWDRYAYVLNNPLRNVDPTGYDCAYLNDAGDAIESVDTDSDATACTQNGGYWLAGSVNPNMLDIYEDGTYGFYDANGNSYDLPERGIYNNYMYGPQPGVGADFSITGTLMASGGIFSPDDMLQPLPGMQAPSMGAYPTPQQVLKPPLQSLKRKVVRFYCGGSPAGAVMNWVETGATKGAIGGGIAGAGVAGVATFGLGGAPGAVIGGVVGAITGAGGGALFGAIAAGVCSAAGAY